MFRSARRSVALVAFCLLAFAPASALVSPEARKLLDRTAAAIEGKSYKVAYTADVETAMMGQPMQAAMAATVTYRDDRHMLMNVTMNMASGPMGAVSIEVIVVHDGTIRWTETRSPMGSQVIKHPIDFEGNLPGAGIGGAQLGKGDPLSNLLGLGKTHDIVIEGVADGVATLIATVNEDGMKLIGDGPGGEAMARLTVLVDEKTAMPREIRAGDAMTMKFGEFQMLETATLADDLFAYSPPEGAQVLDLEQMMKSIGGATAQP